MPGLALSPCSSLTVFLRSLAHEIGLAHVCFANDDLLHICVNQAFGTNTSDAMLKILTQMRLFNNAKL